MTEQPLKIPFIAGVALAINQQKPELTREVLEKAATRVQEYLNAGAWREVKLVLRFLGSLQGILDGDGVFPIFEELFARAVDLQTASSEDVSLVHYLRNLFLMSFIKEPRPRASQDYSSYSAIRHGNKSRGLERPSACYTG